MDEHRVTGAARNVGGGVEEGSGHRRYQECSRTPDRRVFPRQPL